jgi:tRNA threonylcarbamoyladenosine biosynthesis protein TsaB
VSLYLALDTATAFGSVAVGDAGHVVAEVTVGDRRHAAATLPAMQEVLRLAGARFADLDGLVVGDGPGSFTGLRIGFATVKGLWHARQVLSVQTAPSLIAAAWRARAFADGPVAAVYDALRGEVFVAVYRFDGARVDVLLAPQLLAAEDVTRVRPAPAIAVGEGATAYPAIIAAWTGRPPVGPPDGAPRASALLDLRGVAGALVPVADPAAAEPTYGRLAEAQARWEHAHGRPLADPPGHGG